MGAIDLIHTVADLIYAVAAGFLWLLAGAGALLLVLFAPPVHVRAAIDALHIDEGTPFDWRDVSSRAHLIGLFGAAQVRLEHRDRALRTGWRLFGIAREGRPGREEGDSAEREAPAEPGAPGAQREREAKRAGGPRRRLARGKAREGVGAARRRASRINLVALRRLVPEVQWLLRTARRRFRLKVRGQLTYGFPDPFATGLVHGLTCALPPAPGLILQPDYGQGVLDGQVEFSLRVYPLEALVLIARAFFRPGVRQLWLPRLLEQVRRPLRIIPKRTKEAPGP